MGIQAQGPEQRPGGRRSSASKGRKKGHPKEACGLLSVAGPEVTGMTRVEVDPQECASIPALSLHPRPGR